MQAPDRLAPRLRRAAARGSPTRWARGPRRRAPGGKNQCFRRDSGHSHQVDDAITSMVARLDPLGFAGAAREPNRFQTSQRSVRAAPW